MNTEEKNIPIPETLRPRLEETICAAALSEQGPSALDDRPRTGSRHVQRWLRVAVPALALASLAAVLYIHHPQPVPLEMADAYAHFEQAFNDFSDAIRTGMDAFSTPYQETASTLSK